MNVLDTNAWNRFRYSLWAPVYNLLLARSFRRQRQRSFDIAAIQPHERVLLVGAGTGLDLDFLPRDARITATDLTPAMLHRLQKRATRLHLDVDARVMDGQALDLPDNSFDVVVLHLIVAVIPDPARCLQETARVLRPGGRAVVLDKFAPEAGPIPLKLRLIRPFARCVATDVTRRLRPLVAGTGLEIVHDEPVALGGFFRVALLRKPE